MPETASPSSSEAEVPQVEGKTRKPLGVLPRNAQAWVLVGVAALMIAVLALSGNRGSRPTREPDLKVPAVVDPNQARIQEYRNRIEEQARKLAAEQDRLKQAKQMVGLGPTLPPGPAEPPHPYAQGYYQPPSSQQPQKSAIERDKERREYESLFSSNIALSYRDDEEKGASTSGAVLLEATRPPAPLPLNGNLALAAYGQSRPDAPVSDDAGVARSVPPEVVGQAAGRFHEVDPEEDLVDRPILQRRAAAAPTIVPRREFKDYSELNEATGKSYRLFEGTFVETVLTNRLNASFSGPVNCMVTTNVYSHDRQKLLIPQGSRILGEVSRVDHFGQERVAVVFHRIIMPDGYSLSLDRFQGLNQIGETGMKDKVNNHYFKIFGTSAALGAIAGFSLYNTNQGFTQSGGDAYRAGVARSVSQSSLRILDRFLNILPTITIREGHRVKIYLTDDVLVPAYERHQMPSDL